MKNLFKSLMLVAVAAMAFTACQKDNSELDYKQAPAEVNYTFTANFDTTRASFGELEEGVYPVSWDKDEVFEFSGDIMDDSGSVNADCTFPPTTTEFTDANGVVFTVTSFPYDWMKSLADNSVVKAYVKNNAISYGRVSLYGTQKPTATSVDPNFVGLMANFEITSAAEANFEGTFEHVVAYGKLNIPAIEGVEYQSVSIEFEYATEYGSNTASYELNVAGLEEPSYFFACEPLAATKVVVSVVGADATGAAKLYIYEKSFEEGSELTFTAGHVRPVTITGEFTEAAPYYAEGYAEPGYFDWGYDYMPIFLYIYSTATKSQVASIAVHFFDYVTALPEGEYDMMGTYDYSEKSHYINGIEYYYGMSHCDSYNTEPEKSQLIVDYLEEGYRLTYNYILEGETYSVVYEGMVDGIWNPGDLLPLSTPQISASATSDSITFSWEPVENAVSYEVTFGEETFTQSETTYTATGLESDTYYSISVVACPEEGSADYTKSEAGQCEYKTTKDYSNYAYNIELTKCVSVNGTTFEFIGANAKDYLMIYFNPGLSSIVAGNYVGKFGWSSDSALEFDLNAYTRFNVASNPASSFYYATDGVATVVINDDGTYTLDVRVGNSYTFPDGIARFTYTGALEVTVTYGMTEPTHLEYVVKSANQTNFLFSDADGNVLSAVYYNNKVYTSSGTKYSYYQPADGEAVAFTNVKAFDFTDNGDGSYTFNNVEMVDANYVTHKFSNLTFKDGELVGEGGSDDEEEVVETKLYLNPGDWAVDGAWFAAYFFGDGDAWATMTLVEGETNVYELVVPEGGYTNVIFVRMSNSATTPNWDEKWNQTVDLTIPADENTYFTVTGWGNSADSSEGSWSVYDPNASTGGDDSGDEGGSDEGASATLTFADGTGTTTSQAIFTCSGAYNGYVKIGLSSGLVDGTYELAGNQYSGYGTSLWSMNYFADGTVTISGNTIVVVWTVDGIQVTATGTF